MDADERLISLVVALEVLYIVVHEVQIPEVDDIIVFPVRNDQVNGFGLEEIESFLVPLHFHFD